MKFLYLMLLILTNCKQPITYRTEILVNNLIYQKRFNELKVILETFGISMYQDIRLHNNSLIYKFISSGNVDMVEFLLSKEENINKELNFIDGNILDLAIKLNKNYPENTNFKKIINLIKKKGGIERRRFNKEIYRYILKNDRKKILKILNKGGDITSALNYYFWKTLDENIMKIKEYLKFGADINRVVIIFSENNSKNNYLKKFISYNNVNNSNFMTSPLLSAAHFKKYSLMDYLIKQGADINLRVKINFPIFGYHFKNVSTFEAMFQIKDLKILEYFLKKDVVTYNIDYVLLLNHFAHNYKKRKEAIKLFLKYNYNFKFRVKPKGLFPDDYKYMNTETTPLIIAIKLKYFDIAKMIYDKTYLNYVETCLHKTALDYSIESRNKEIISLLRKHGAKRSCEILKTKCEPLSLEIEKILNGDK